MMTDIDKLYNDTRRLRYDFYRLEERVSSDRTFVEQICRNMIIMPELPKNHTYTPGEKVIAHLHGHDTEVIFLMEKDGKHMCWLPQAESLSVWLNSDEIRSVTP